MAARLYRTVFGLMWAAVVVGAFMLWHSPSMGSATFRPQDDLISLHPLAHPFAYPLLPTDELATVRRSYLAALKSLDTFSFGYNKTHNDRQFTNMVHCLEEGEHGRGRCATKVPRLIVVTEWYFVCGLNHCSTTGEVIWLAPVALSLEAQGHYVVVVRPDEVTPIWRLLGDMITQVWQQDAHVVDCLNDRQVCAQSAENPRGIPPWKLFGLTFWGSMPGHGYWGAPHEAWSFNPLGPEWILTPYRMPNHTYLGYAFEGCTDGDVVPHSQRDNTVVVYAKRVNHFHTVDTWPSVLYSAASNATGLSFVTTASHDDDSRKNGQELPPGLSSTGYMQRKDYDLMVGKAKVMLGMGRPAISPSPYAALCQGTPVILPYHSGEQYPKGWDMFELGHQHAIAASLGPPYTYSLSVHAPLEEIIETIKTASESEIGRYIPPDMTQQAMDLRIERIVETDWELVARAKFATRSDRTGKNVNLNEIARLPDYLVQRAKPWGVSNNLFG